MFHYDQSLVILYGTDKIILKEASEKERERARGGRGNIGGLVLWPTTACTTLFLPGEESWKGFGLDEMNLGHG